MQGGLPAGRASVSMTGSVSGSLGSSTNLNNSQPKRRYVLKSVSYLITKFSGCIYRSHHDEAGWTDAECIKLKC